MSPIYLFSPRENIIEQENSITDKKENPTIDKSITFDEVIIEEPVFECHENIVCSSPKKYPTREDIMVE